MPIIPMLPAKETRIVLAFLVSMFLKLKLSAVKKLIEVFGFLPLFASELFLFVLFSVFLARFLSVFSLHVGSAALSAAASSSVTGILSETSSPSKRRMILDEYLSASSGLCVTITISLSEEISFSSSII